MRWGITSDRPVYIQIMEYIQSQIISGYYKAGDRLPSVRDLATEASVNPNTMQKALSELERLGLINTNRTSGRFITNDNQVIKDIKKTIANNYINDFFSNMYRIGFNKDDIIALIKNK